jgi:hypothetical protein
MRSRKALGIDQSIAIFHTTVPVDVAVGGAAALGGIHLVTTLYATAAH